ncbi:MAG: TonB-dependent receptor [Planctomycetes bacterium]|nr:TonB-dependent receptor [Planctomycetota bacterium]
METTRTAAATTLNQTTIETTPILGRKFEDLLTLTPGVSVVQGPDGDEITFAGQRGVFNNISLDGGDYNNGFFGEQMGGQRAAIDITLDAVREFQVVATGANAEFGRTAGGVVNVITKSGTNKPHGTLFWFQRLEGLTSNTSDGKPLKDFRREQGGGTFGGPIVKDKAFFFLALEGVRENLQRPNLSEPIGTACSVPAPTIGANEALINANPDCQRLALVNFFKASRNQDEGKPVDHQINNNAVLAKFDWAINPKNNLSLSYNFNYSKNTNQTFDVTTFGLRERDRGALEDQHAQPEPLHVGVHDEGERVPHHVFAGEPAAVGHRVERPGRYRHRLRPVIPFRQPVLPRAQRR